MIISYEMQWMQSILKLQLWATKMVQRVKAIAVQARESEFGPNNPHKGRQRERT